MVMDVNAVRPHAQTRLRLKRPLREYAQSETGQAREHRAARKSALARSVIHEHAPGWELTAPDSLLPGASVNQHLFDEWRLGVSRPFDMGGVRTGPKILELSESDFTSYHLEHRKMPCPETASARWVVSHHGHWRGANRLWIDNRLR